MKKPSVILFTTLCLSLATFTSCALKRAFSPPLRVLHYNIYELESSKLGLEKNDQVTAIKELLTEIDFNILSINEIENNGANPSNLNLLLQKVKPHDLWYESFFAANTGKSAKKRNGRYVRGKEKSRYRHLADQINYGHFPGQYSTGMASTYDIKEKIVIDDLQWKEFNQNIKLKKFRTAQEKRLPKTIELFDKNFTDTVLQVGKKKVHIITLHTVPAFHFGNKKSPNYKRNRDQLRFLEWYLTGKTETPVSLPKRLSHISPLKPGTTFIAMGDWNTDIRSNSNPGSMVLKRLANTGRLLPKEGHSFESPHYGPDRLKMRLDYIFYSSDLELRSFETLIPKEARLFLGCKEKGLHRKASKGRVVHTFKSRTKEKEEECSVSVTSSFHRAKTASDHFPLYAEFNFKN